MKYLIFLLIVPITVFADFNGKVTRVIDGDTIEVLNNIKPVRVRLYGIDAPEKKQPYGRKSTNFLKSLIAVNYVFIEEKGQDVYGRTLGMVYFNNTNINREMVKNGFAWAYDYKGNYSIKEFKQLQDNAKNNRLGLWQDKHAMKPYDFRKLNKK